MTAELIPGPGWPGAPPPEYPPPIADEAARALTFRLPVNNAAEMAYLGAILHDNRAYLNTAGQVQAQDFAYRIHGQIFEAMAKLIARGQIADPITLKQYFEANEDLVAIGGFRYLMALADSLVSAINAKGYARAILDASRRRQAIALAARMIEELAEGGKGAAFETSLSDAALALESLSLAAASMGARRAKEHIRDYLNAVAAAAGAAPGQISGVPTGLTRLDRALSGLKRAGLTVIGARPGMGKSLLALSIARRALTHPPAASPRRRHNVALFSLEMSGADVIARQIAAETGIPVLAHRRPGLPVQTFDRLAAAGAGIEDQPLWIDDRAGLTAEQIRLEARRLHRKTPLDLIVVDYLQIMGRPTQPGVNPVQHIGQMTRGLRALAKETGAAVLLLSQLSRGLESRDDKRPHLADLRESGDIEQDADAVLLLHREAYYLERSPPQKRERETDADFSTRLFRHSQALDAARDTLDIFVAKNRDGALDTIRVRADLEKMTVSDLEPCEADQ